MNASTPGSIPCVASSNASSAKESYGQILKSTSIVGGAQGLNLIIGLVRTKIVAILLGPSGIGLVGLYQSVCGTISTLSGLGLSSSGVRQVAEAASLGDQQRIDRAAAVLKRMCWITGIAGGLLSLALAWPLSQWMFTSGEHTGAIAVLGLVCLMDSVSSARSALIQGLRHIGNLARVQVMSAISGTLISICLYFWLGEKGIVPVLLVTAATNLGIACWFTRKIGTPTITLSWKETWVEAQGLVSLGMAFMLSGLVASGLTLATRAVIVKYFGMEANGLYQAAWGISGVFAGFVLQAMGADFYPRLTAVANDNDKVNQMVNEQTEVGVLLALPGLIMTLIFAPWIIHVLYSARFTGAENLLPWFVLGIFGRVVSWPLAFIQLAKGASRWYGLTEIAFSFLHLLLVFVALPFFGLKGVAVAFVTLYVIYTGGILWIAKHLSGFKWSSSTLRLLAGATMVTFLAFVLAHEVSSGWFAGAGGGLVVLTSLMCLRTLCQRLDANHRVVRWIKQVPGIGRWLVSPK